MGLQKFIKETVFRAHPQIDPLKDMYEILEAKSIPVISQFFTLQLHRINVQFSCQITKFTQ